MAAAAPLKIRLPETDTLVTRSALETLRNTLQTQQGAVQSRLGSLQLVRGDILSQKAVFLEHFNEFTTCLDANYRNTNLYRLRPYAPGINAGQGTFSDALGDMLVCWEEVNAGPAPAGIALPLTLSGGLTKDAFASQVSALQFTYADEKSKDKKVTLARGARNDTQEEIYFILKAYREGVPDKMKAFPLLVETMPRLTPLPGHTPEAVNSSAIFEAPDRAKIVYDASTDGTLYSYQLRGNVGSDYNDEDAVVIATNAPGAPREFITPFGLNQPGARIALKVYVILTTGNESGSAAMFVERPMSLELAA